MSKEPDSLQRVLDFLTTLARESGANMSTNLQLEQEGATLSVHWEGCEENAVPRESNLYFGESSDGNPDTFLWAFVVDPRAYMYAIEEGFDETSAANHATHLVESLDEIGNYLTGRKYQYYRPTNDKVDTDLDADSD